MLVVDWSLLQAAAAAHAAHSSQHFSAPAPHQYWLAWLRAFNALKVLAMQTPGEWG